MKNGSFTISFLISSSKLAIIIIVSNVVLFLICGFNPVQFGIPLGLLKERIEGAIEHLIPRPGLVIGAITTVELKDADIVVDIDLGTHIDRVQEVNRDINIITLHESPFFVRTLHVDTGNLVLRLVLVIEGEHKVIIEAAITVTLCIHFEENRLVTVFVPVIFVNRKYIPFVGIYEITGPVITNLSILVSQIKIVKQVLCAELRVNQEFVKVPKHLFISYYY